MAKPRKLKRYTFVQTGIQLRELKRSSRVIGNDFKKSAYLSITFSPQAKSAKLTRQGGLFPAINLL